MSSLTLKKACFVIASLPKTIFFNLKTFGISGIRCPVLVSYKTKITETHKGVIKIERMKPFSITVGYGGSAGIVSKSYSEICLEKNSLLIFLGKAHFAEGCSIRNSGKMRIGSRFSMNKNSFLSCYNYISIGDDFSSGWEVNIRDSDGHYIIKKGERKPLSYPVHIGNKVWICSCSDVLKGVSIGDSCVVAYRSLVTKKFPESNVMIAGTPAQVVQTEIDWES